MKRTSIRIALLVVGAISAAFALFQLLGGVNKIVTPEVPVAPDLSDAVTLRISNYPMLGPDSNRYATDAKLIDQARALTKDLAFVPWSGYQRFREQQARVVGGYSCGLALLDTDGVPLIEISYNPGITQAGAPGKGAYTVQGDAAFTLDGDQTEFIDFMETCVTQAKEEAWYSPEDAALPAAERTWLFEDELA